MVVFHHGMVFFHGDCAQHNCDFWLTRVMFLVSDLNVEAVLLFFLISGFSITLSSHKLDLMSRSGIRDYTIKRMVRLLPLFWTALLITALLAWISGTTDSGKFDVCTLLGNLFFLQSPVTVAGNWFAPFGGNYPLWSLSFEVFFYALFPLLVVLLSMIKGKRLARLYLEDFLAAMISLLGLLSNQILPNPISLFASYYLIWHLGLILARQHLGHRADRVQSTVIAIAGILVLFLALRTVESTTLVHIQRALLFFVLWQGLIAIHRRRLVWFEAIQSIFNSVFHQIGLISYAIYLFHYPIMDWLSTMQGPRLLWLSAALVLTLILAYIAESLFRKVTMKVNQHLINRHHASP